MNDTTEQVWEVNVTKEWVDPLFVTTFDDMAESVYEWAQRKGFHDRDGNDGERIALMHSELSEGLESLRIRLPDNPVFRADRSYARSDHIPDFAGIEEELADCVIRILDYAGKHKLRIGEAVMEKMAFNEGRPRLHGKRF
jgi:NTP pyrophosphatase (non-canonical NTP hydrolase)